MKNKFLKNLIALTCVFTLGLGVIAGCNSEPECEHVYTWTVHAGDESTCTAPGKRTGVCGLCGDVKEEELPIDENAHAYTGEWAITLPTEESDGLAVKSCANNPEHKAEVVLPQVTITGKGYDSKEFITVPTTAREGEMKLVLNNTYGAISFNVPLAKRKLNNMDDAVILASSLKENVRSVTGSFKQGKDAALNQFSYYFGNDYTYINNGADNIEYWYSLDEEGKVFAMSKNAGESSASVVTSPDAGYLNGFHYNSSVNISTFFGAEQGLAQLYETAMNGLENGNTVNYQESEVQPENNGSVKDVWFSYSYYNEGWFNRFYVKFSTYSDGTLKELTVETEVIRSYMFATEADGTPIFYKEGDGYVDDYGFEHEHAVGDIVFGYEYPTDFTTGGVAYEYDKDGNLVYEQVDDSGRVIYAKEEDGETVYYAVVGGREEEQADGSLSYITEYERLSEKPANLYDVYVYDAYGMQLFDSNGNPIKKIMARGGYPVTKHYSDEHSEVSYRTVTFTQTRKTADDVVEENPYPSDSLYIKDFDIVSASIAGGTTITFENGTATLPTNTAINLNIGNIKPASAGLKYDAIAGVYVVDQTGNRIKLKMDFSNGSVYKILGFYSENGGFITINSKYAGEVKFLFVTQSGKCEKEVTITFAKSAPKELTALASVYTVTDGIINYVNQVVNSENFVTITVGQSLTFKAVAMGEEAAYVSTDIYPSCATEGLTFAQVEKDSYEEWSLVADREGEYIVEMPYYDGESTSADVYTSFKVVVKPKLGVMETLSGNTFSGSVLISSGSGNPKSKMLTATFTADGEINIAVAGNEIVYTYGIDGSGVLTTAWKSGIEPTQKSYDFAFTINEAGDLVVTHQTGMGNDTEEIVLIKQVAA